MPKPGPTDTVFDKVQEGTHILNREAVRLVGEKTLDKALKDSPPTKLSNPVPVMLTPGEYKIPPNAAKVLGESNLEKANKVGIAMRHKIQGYQLGGLVQSQPPASAGIMAYKPQNQPLASTQITNPLNAYNESKNQNNSTKELLGNTGAQSQIGAASAPTSIGTSQTVASNGLDVSNPFNKSSLASESGGVGGYADGTDILGVQKKKEEEALALAPKPSPSPEPSTVDKLKSAGGGILKAIEPAAKTALDYGKSVNTALDKRYGEPFRKEVNEFFGATPTANEARGEALDAAFKQAAIDDQKAKAAGTLSPSGAPITTAATGPAPTTPWQGSAVPGVATKEMPNVSDTGLPYKTSVGADGKSTVEFTNPSGKGRGIISGLTPEQAARFNDKKGTASFVDLSGMKGAEPQQQELQRPSVSGGGGRDYSEAIASALGDLAEEAPTRGFDAMVAHKKKTENAKARLGILRDLQGQSANQASEGAGLAARQQQAAQERADRKEELLYGREKDTAAAASAAEEKAYQRGKDKAAQGKKTFTTQKVKVPSDPNDPLSPVVEKVVAVDTSTGEVHDPVAERAAATQKMESQRGTLSKMMADPNVPKEKKDAILSQFNTQYPDSPYSVL